MVRKKFQFRFFERHAAAAESLCPDVGVLNSRLLYGGIGNFAEVRAVGIAEVMIPQGVNIIFTCVTKWSNIEIVSV